MYILNLAQRLIYNKPLLHIIVTIQLVASFFVIETAISTLTLTTGSSKFMENLLDSNFCYYSIAERNISIDDNGNIVVNNSDVFLEDCLVGVEAIMQNDYVGLNVENAQVSMQLQSSAFLEKTSQELLKGDIFTDGNYEENVIRVLTNNTDLAPGTYYNGEIIDFEGNTTNVKIKVTGIYQKPAYILETTTAGSTLSSANISHIMNEYNKIENSFTCVGCLEDYEKLIGTSLKHPLNKTSMILFSDSISQQQINQNFEFLKNHGVVLTASEIKEITKSDNLSIIKSHLPTFIFLLAVSVCGILSVSTINILQQIKTLSLYGILGCSKKDIYKIIYCYIAILCIIPIFVIWGVLFVAKYFNAFVGYFLTISPINYIIPVLLSIILLLVVPIIPIRLFKKQKLIGLKRENS